MVTVAPANTTALPAVATDRAAASWAGMPAARFSLCRVVMNSA